MSPNASSVMNVIALSGFILSGCAGAPGDDNAAIADIEQDLSTSVCPAGVPPELTPGADQTIDRSVTGIGVQIYICNATATGFAWTFIAPQANLLNAAGDLVGTHFIGPTWQANDGSSVAAARVAGVSVDPTAVPWLLLAATSHGAVDGRYSDVTSIQRLSTVGGVAPTTSCDATQLGSIAQVPYSAQYVFYTTKDHGRVKQCSGD